jgi:hypothetical protein
MRWKIATLWSVQGEFGGKFSHRRRLPRSTPPEAQGSGSVVQSVVLGSLVQAACRRGRWAGLGVLAGPLLAGHGEGTHLGSVAARSKEAVR